MSRPSPLWAKILQKNVLVGRPILRRTSLVRYKSHRVAIEYRGNHEARESASSSTSSPDTYKRRSLSRPPDEERRYRLRSMRDDFNSRLRNIRYQTNSGRHGTIHSGRGPVDKRHAEIMLFSRHGKSIAHELGESELKALSKEIERADQHMLPFLRRVTREHDPKRIKFYISRLKSHYQGKRRKQIFLLSKTAFLACRDIKMSIEQLEIGNVKCLRLFAEFTAAWAEFKRTRAALLMFWDTALIPGSRNAHLLRAQRAIAPSVALNIQLGSITTSLTAYPNQRGVSDPTITQHLQFHQSIPVTPHAPSTSLSACITTYRQLCSAVAKVIIEHNRRSLEPTEHVAYLVGHITRRFIHVRHQLLREIAADLRPLEWIAKGRNARKAGNTFGSHIERLRDWADDYRAHLTVYRYLVHEKFSRMDSQQVEEMVKQARRVARQLYSDSMAEYWNGREKTADESEDGFLDVTSSVKTEEDDD